MNKLAIVFASAALLATTPAFAAETITATFTQPDGGQTVGLYRGIVNVRVSGTGFSLGPNINDAFYQVPSGSYIGGFYQLTFATTTLVGGNPAQNAVNFIVGGLPAFSANNIYNFRLNTGTATPSILHFGVGDGNFGDNGGSYTITVSAIPEPATWAMLIIGFAAIGFGMRRAAPRSAIRFDAKVKRIAAGHEA